MRLSLLDYLRCGRLECIRAGTSKAEIEAILGPPKDWSVESRRRRNWKPAIWKYDSLEIFFAHPERANSITFNPDGWPDSAFVFPPEWTVADWGLRAGTPSQEVRAFLDRHDLPIDTTPSPRVLPHMICLAGSGVLLVSDDDILWSISGTLT